MKNFFKEPLLHFLIIGAALFICFDQFSDSGGANENKIVITSGEIEALKANFARTWQRPPTDKEIEGLIEDKLRVEIAYREALAMGLDRNDPYIRQRLKMKMELLLEDIGTLVQPTDQELLEFLESNRSSFTVEPQIGLRHVYFDPAKHGDALEADAQNVLQQLNKKGVSRRFEEYGDPILLPREYALSPVNVIKRQFGGQFTEELLKLKPGTWQGPVWSSYGLHLVLIDSFVEGRDPDLAEVREAVERELMAKKRKDIKEETYSKLRQRYQIEVELEQWTGA